MQSFVTVQKQYSQRVDNALEEKISQLPFNQASLAQAMNYGTLLGGKRLRPFLVYAVGKMLGVSLANLDAPAAAIECIHAYSLIHDDLPAMDNDDLRRGQPTCHIRFGESHAILAGDALQTLAFSILADTPMDDVAQDDRITMFSFLASASGAAGMCLGQALDLESERKAVDVDTLEQIHRHKTGALIKAAIQMGAVAAGRQGRQLLPLLEEFAEKIGLAFQIQDDILDVIGETDKTGKRQGADLEHQKSTYPALLGLAQAKEKAQLLHDEAMAILQHLANKDYDVSQLQALTNFIIKRDN